MVMSRVAPPVEAATATGSSTEVVDKKITIRGLPLLSFGSSSSKTPLSTIASLASSPAPYSYEKRTWLACLRTRSPDPTTRIELHLDNDMISSIPGTSPSSNQFIRHQSHNSSSWPQVAQRSRSALNVPSHATLNTGTPDTTTESPAIAVVAANY
ncbi:uncharacterized protein CLUP02_13182 [Colletotrichum lupini]|uniref:Uncharacterized protein n=1 Tax=Colletotrichum lupini TaxID=145971 RepID=A0A9Q8T1T9_9PEZI|nr:uncharacterized protein CLUP02_13182 [Colletotrichum lupini]UQC87664.1 hypothetical protein CLUP02_13182 [Colletotrichum lupini]